MRLVWEGNFLRRWKYFDKSKIFVKFFRLTACGSRGGGGRKIWQSDFFCLTQVGSKSSLSCFQSYDMASKRLGFCCTIETECSKILTIDSRTNKDMRKSFTHRSLSNPMLRESLHGVENFCNVQKLLIRRIKQKRWCCRLCMSSLQWYHEKHVEN